MPFPRSILAAMLGVAALALPVVSRAAGGAASIAPGDVCPDGRTVNPQLLFRLLLATYEPKLDDKAALQAVADPADHATDFAQHPGLYNVLGDTGRILSDQLPKQFNPLVKDLTPQQYYADFANDRVDAIACVVAAGAPPPPPPALQTAGLRVRGAATDLGYDRTTDPGYAGASKATINLGDNGVTAVRTSQVQLAVGYAFPFGEDQKDAVILYGAANYSDSDTKGKPDKVSSETVNAGVAAAFEDFPFSDALFSATFDYLHDYQDHASILSLHPILTPQKVGVLNNPRNFHPDQIGCKGLTCAPYWTLLADVRMDLGVYTQKGMPVGAPNVDFARIGGRVGLDVALANWYDLTVTNTYLYGFAGSLKNINDFQSSLTYYFGSQNVFGLTLAYKKGRVETTTQPEQTWSIGLTGKY